MCLTGPQDAWGLLLTLHGPQPYPNLSPTHGPT
jgi:hypothetical protein